MRFIFVILHTLIVTQSCVSSNLQVTVEHAPLKACNAISEGVTQQLLNALDYKFEMLRKEIQSDIGFKEYLKIDRTFRKICEKSNVKDGNGLDTLKKTYKESIENATPSIIILYDDEGFKQKISDNIDTISKNPVGAQLLIDILVENCMKSAPIVLISREMARHITPTIIKHGGQLLTKVTRIECDDPLSFFCYGNQKCGHIICISMNKFSYNTLSEPKEGFCSISKSSTLYDTHQGMDTTIFHELNHYRHYLQSGQDLYIISQQKSTNMLVGIYNNNALLQVPFNAMYSKEEELQLIGQNGSEIFGIHSNRDVISENIYRHYARNKKLRFPYSSDICNGGKVSENFISYMLELKKYYEYN